MRHIDNWAGPLRWPRLLEFCKSCLTPELAGFPSWPTHIINVVNRVEQYQILQILVHSQSRAPVLMTGLRYYWHSTAQTMLSAMYQLVTREVVYERVEVVLEARLGREGGTEPLDKGGSSPTVEDTLPD
jgi:hypothetical protein